VSYLQLKQDTCIAVFPKVASQSIQFAAFANGAVEITPSEAAVIENRVMFLRQPLVRLQSAFSWFMQLTVEGTKYETIMPSTILGTGTKHETKPLQEAWEAFIDHVLSVDVMSSDEHWQPQITQATYNDVLIPNRAFKFEELNARWGTHSVGRLPGTLEHMHAVTKLYPVDYRKSELLIYYADDIEAYGRL